MTLIALHYNILKKIGSGSFGTVHVVEDIWTKKLSIIKIFDKVPLADIQEKLLPEMMYKITNLTHENLIKVFDYGINQNNLYSLLQFFEGKGLQKFHLTQKNKKEFLQIVVQICYALHHLHSNNIIHKDLKLENVLYKTENSKTKVKVCDFGFNKIISQTDFFLEKNVATLPYLAPEVLQENPFSPQSDFYSLGVMLYYIATGTFPFSKEEIDLIAEKKSPTIIPQFPSQINSAVDKGLEDLIFKMIEFNPNLRFNNAIEIIKFINKTYNEKFSLFITQDIAGKVRTKKLKPQPISFAKLKDFVKSTVMGNGKILFITGDTGIGKKQSMHCFKWDLFSEDFHTFYYYCSEYHKDPFFLLCKEIYISQNEKGRKKFETEASEKFSEFLFRSETKSLQLGEDEAILQKEFVLVRDYISTFSKIKPIIYFVSDIDMCDKSTINFLKFLSKDIHNFPILIVASTDDISLVNSVSSADRLNLQPLSRTETYEYIRYLLETDCEENFLANIYQISNGNQLFVKSLLVSLIEKKLILDKNGVWHFDIDREKLTLTSEIDNLIQKKISRIPNSIYPKIAKLSILQIPLSPEIIKYILEFESSKDLFFFLQGCEELGILCNDDRYTDEGYYKFTYPALKERLFADVLFLDKKAISKKVLMYFQNKEITKLFVMDGLIVQSRMAKEHISFIKYQMAKASCFFDAKDFTNAQKTGHIGIKNLEKIKEKIPNNKIKEYLILFMKTCLIVGNYESAAKYFKTYQKEIQIDFQLLFLYANLLTKSNKFSLSQTTLQEAKKIADPEKKNDVEISLIELYTLSQELPNSAKQIKMINLNALLPRQAVEFYLQKANFHYASAEYKKTIEELKNGEKIAKKNSLFPELGKIYKVLADTYNMQNQVEKAFHFYEETTIICKKEGDLFTLANAFSHWGFLFFKKGKLREGIEKLKHALHYFRILDNKTGIAEANLNLAQIIYKFGDFPHSNHHFQVALKVARDIKNEKLLKKVLNKYSFLKLKISSPTAFRKFLQKNYPEYFKENKISEINSFLKNYVFYLREIGNEKSIEKILDQIENQNCDCSLEQEFLLQSKGWLERSKGNINSALTHFKRAITIAKTNQNDYALMINYYNMSETYLTKGNIKQAEIYCDLATSLANKNKFSRWQNYAKLIHSKILLKNPEVKFRVILRALLQTEKIAEEMKDWSLICQSRFYIMLVYRMLHLKKLELSYKRKYQNQINILINGLNKKDRDTLKNKFNYYFDASKKGVKDFTTSRTYISATKLQHRFFDLLQLTSEDQIKFSLQKYIKEILGIERFAIILPETTKRSEEYWLNCDFNTKIQNSKHQPYFEQVINEKEVRYYKIEKINYCITPLLLRQELIGTIVFADDGELPFTKAEKLIIKLSSFYLTVILKKIGEYQEALEQREHLSYLLTISRDILQIMDLQELENRIVLNALQLSEAERGFFITLDESNNFVFDCVLLKSGEKIEKSNLRINKSVLKDVSTYGTAITTNAIEETSEPDEIGTSTKDFYSIYCAPLNVNNADFGFLYLDNLGGTQRTMRFNKDLLEIFLLAAETAIKNSLDYQKLYQANEELLKIDQERANFINISSHEFNTPIQTLKGYLQILKDENISIEDKKSAFKSMEINVNRLVHAVNNVLQMNVLENTESQLVKEKIDIKDILQIVHNETKIFTDQRKQKFLLKLDDELKPVYAERNLLINAVKNLVLNAIKFTEDYGQIIIGARKSKFKNEKIDNEETDVIYVKDNGIGIPSYELENIFKEFYEVADIKAHHSGLTEFESSGLGLGLPVTKSIIELFAGKVWAESVKGEGSTFFIALLTARQKVRKAK